jgi:peptidoglycan/LPS O-acetylase OafA/YrhL
MFFIFIAAMEFVKNSSSALMKVFCYIGVLSYPIYLLHQDVGYIIIGAGEEYFSRARSAVLAIVV